MISTVLLVLLVLLLVGALPIYPHSRNWGYMPSAGVVVLIILLILLL